MSACVKCWFDADAKVSRAWNFFVDRRVPSLNDRVFNAGATRFAYGKERDAWCWEFRRHKLALGISKARAKRRVTMVRVFSARERERDLDNLAGGMKACCDAMVIEGLLLDDNRSGVEIHYDQRRDKVSGLFVTIEEFA